MYSVTHATICIFFITNKLSLAQVFFIAGIKTQGPQAISSLSMDVSSNSETQGIQLEQDQTTVFSVTPNALSLFIYNVCYLSHILITVEIGTAYFLIIYCRLDAICQLGFNNQKSDKEKPKVSQQLHCFFIFLNLLSTSK